MASQAHRYAHSRTFTFLTTVSGVSPAVTPVVSFKLPAFIAYLTPPPVSFAGLGFLSFYIAGKLHLFDKRGHAVRMISSIYSLTTLMICDCGPQPKAWISLAPLSGAALVAISRTMDYRRT